MALCKDNRRNRRLCIWGYVRDIKGIEVTYGTGSRVVFEECEDNPGTYKTPYGTYDKLEMLAPGVFTLTTKDQEVYEYRSGRLTSVTDKHGNKIKISYVSDQDKRISKIEEVVNRNDGIEFIERSLIFSYEKHGDEYYLKASLTTPEERWNMTMLKMVK